MSAVSRPVVVRRAASASWWKVWVAVRQLFEYADLFLTLTRHRIRVRYRQAFLGIGWAVVQPIAIMMIFTLVFSRIARMPSEGIPYPLFAYSGLLLWSAFSTALTSATHALVSHAPLITKVYFPREILPLTYVAAALFDLTIGSSVLIGLLLYHEIAIGWTWIAVVPIVLLLAIIVASLSFCCSAIQVRFRDVGLAIPLLLYLWMFVTPIAYPLDAVPTRYRGWVELNPMTGLVESFRAAVLHGTWPDPAALTAPAVTALVLLPLSYLLFKRVEATMADVI
jgi:lipopolysaccharide transport system permease protein